MAFNYNYSYGGVSKPRTRRRRHKIIKRASEQRREEKKQKKKKKEKEKKGRKKREKKERTSCKLIHLLLSCLFSADSWGRKRALVFHKQPGHPDPSTNPSPASVPGTGDLSSR